MFKDLIRIQANISEQRHLVPVKIIEEPALFLANLNLQNFENLGARSHGINNIVRIDKSNELESKFKPANFSGPPQLEELNGKCFEYIHQKLVGFFFN